MFVPTVLHRATLVPQALVADTHTGGAPVYIAGKLTVIDGVFCPLVIVVPAGVVQLYPLAPVTDGTVNTTPVAPGHTFEGPAVNVPGIAGLLLTVMHLGALVELPPHDNAAVTHRLPVVKPLGKVTCTLAVPCPLVTGAADPDKVQL
jgi:hypothetical protein